MGIYRFQLDEVDENTIKIFIKANSKQEAEEKLRYGDYAGYNIDQFIEETNGAYRNEDEIEPGRYYRELDFDKEILPEELPKNIVPLE